VEDIRAGNSLIFAPEIYHPFIHPSGSKLFPLAIFQVKCNGGIPSELLVVEELLIQVVTPNCASILSSLTDRKSIYNHSINPFYFPHEHAKQKLKNG
jgi:hypothetical protein